MRHSPLSSVAGLLPLLPEHHPPTSFVTFNYPMPKSPSNPTRRARLGGINDSVSGPFSSIRVGWSPGRLTDGSFSSARLKDRLEVGEANPVPVGELSCPLDLLAIDPRAGPRIHVFDEELLAVPDDAKMLP
jgi:hypothetical protein